MTIETKILALLAGLTLTSSLGFGNLLVKRDLASLIDWVSHGKQDPQKLGSWACKSINMARHLGCSFSLIPGIANHTMDCLSKQGASQLVFFVGESFAALSCYFVIFTFLCLQFPLMLSVSFKDNSFSLLLYSTWVK